MRALFLIALLFGGAVRVGALELRAVGSDLSGFRLPIDLAPLPDDSAAVLEDLDGAVRVAHGSSRSAVAGVTSPRALAVDETGLLLVLDGSATVIGFRRGREMWRVKLVGDPRPPGKAAGMAARNGIIWLLDRTSPKAFLFAFDGQSLGSVDLKAWARSPFSVALGPAGEAFITDPLGPAVLSLSPSGTYQGSFKLGGTGVTRPTGIAVDGPGRIWVSDGVTGVVACFSAKGEPIPVTHSGKRPRFQDPIRLGWSRGSLWVLEGRPGRIKRMQTEEP